MKLTKEKIKIWADLLKDLTEKQFIDGISKFCLEHPEIYPGTNVIAHIRNYGLNKVKRDLRTEALVIYHRGKQFCLNNNMEIDVEAANQSFATTNSMSTGLIVDKQWDEKRFIDLYAGMAK